MDTFDFTEIDIDSIVTHHIGNKLRDEGCFLSESVSMFDDDTKSILQRYFINSLKTDILYKFTHTIDVKLNSIYSLLSDKYLNNSEESFVQMSQDIAKLLYNNSMHPKIKDGNLNVIRISNVLHNNNYTTAIGIFKSEMSVPFIKMNKCNEKYEINHEYGFEVNNIDKGCLIVNCADDYKILIIDNTNKSEAQYWTNDFLNVTQCQDEYYNTQNVMNLAKSFIKELPNEFEVSRADQVDLANRTSKFFKEKDSFDMEEFANEVIEQPEVIESFNRYKEAYAQERDIEFTDSFAISDSAVKKGARALKSVIKLDKNFHIYIHGDRNKIENGEDEKGKFYKVYYNEEM